MLACDRTHLIERPALAPQLLDYGVQPVPRFVLELIYGLSYLSLIFHINNSVHLFYSVVYFIWFMKFSLDFMSSLKISASIVCSIL